MARGGYLRALTGDAHPHPASGRADGEDTGVGGGGSGENQSDSDSPSPESSRSRSVSRNHNRDSTHMQGRNQSVMMLQSENPGLTLVSVPLSVDNFLSWRRGMILALEVKEKLDFILQDAFVPDSTSLAYAKWKKNDSLVMSWILNSISRDLVESFIYAKSARELWSEIEDHFGENNGPLLYQLKREISSLTQGTSSLLMYYNKLKKLWEELSFLRPLPVCHCIASQTCICHAIKRSKQMSDEDQVIQFLISLNKEYDALKSQVLLMDPMPELKKVYAMVQRVAKQREISMADFHSIEFSHAAVSTKTYRYQADVKGKKKGSKTSDKFCTYCKDTKHNRDSCFKLVGYPDWYKGRRDPNAPCMQVPSHNSTTYQAHNVVDSPLDYSTPVADDRTRSMAVGALPKDFSSLVQQEVLKMMKSKGLMEDTSSSGGNSVFAGFAGPGF